MMRQTNTSRLVGVVIVLFGVAVLIQNMGLFGRADDLVWSILFGAGGLVAMSAVVQSPERWWALIPGAALLSLSTIVGLSVVAPALGAWGGTIFLAGLSLGFWGVYLLQRRFWWAIIPGGTLLTLAMVTVLGDRGLGHLSGAALFLGLAATFGLVSFVPSDGPRRWGLFPAAVMAVMGLTLFANRPMVMQIGWPLLLIVVGLAVLYRSRHRPDIVHDQPEHKAL
jgi:hypothetical protein